MSGDQPHNLLEHFGAPIDGMVLITDSELVSKFRGQVTIRTDLYRAEGGIRHVLEQSERILAERRAPTRDEIRSAQEAWSDALAAYGRCFMGSEGRKSLTISDTVKMGGNEVAHTLLMEARHGVVAHATLQSRMVEVFAVLKEECGAMVVSNLSVIESYDLLPSIGSLRMSAEHCMTIGAALLAEMQAAQVRLCKILSQRHIEELRECLDGRRAWAGGGRRR